MAQTSGKTSANNEQKYLAEEPSSKKGKSEVS